MVDVPIELSLLSEAHCGNVRCRKGECRPIRPGDSLVQRGRRGQQPGILFDSAYPGFTPSKWEQVVLPPWMVGGTPGRNEFTFKVASSKASGEPSLVHVWFPPSNLTGKKKGWQHSMKMSCRAAHIAAHCNRRVRTNDHSQGLMVGMGEHVWFDGRPMDYKPTEELPRKRVRGNIHDQRSALHHASQILKQFEGKNLGVEDIIAASQRLDGSYGWRCAISSGLVNPAHIDPSDSTRSIAQWTRYRQDLPEPRDWWFLFPDVGLAIRLCHGAVVCWDGRVVRHCTALGGQQSGDEYLSLFFSGNQLSSSLKRRQQEFIDVVNAKSLWGEKVLCVGDHVWVRWQREGDPCSHHWRRRSACITEVVQQGVGVVVYGIKVLFDDVGPCGREEKRVPVADVVPAGAIWTLGLCVDDTLVGKRERVYWQGEDACYDGQVLALKDGQICQIEYDDGAVVDEQLGSEDTPYFRII